jgi:hypothetical protein
MSQEWALAGLEPRDEAKRRERFDRGLVVGIVAYDEESGRAEVALHPAMSAEKMPLGAARGILTDAVAQLQREIQRIAAAEDDPSGRLSIFAQASVSSFISLHGESRFKTLGEDGTDEAIPPHFAGWRKRDGASWLFLIRPEIWRSEVVISNPEASARALRDAGILVPGENGRLQRKMRVGDSTARVYVVRDAGMRQAA